MGCYRPLDAWRRDSGEIVFQDRGDGRYLQLPCGRCIGCLTSRKRQWWLRLCHEAQMHSASSVVTLTYSPECVPPDGGLHYEHIQAFNRAVRKRCGRFRYYVGGEYGERTLRPHWHAVLFGVHFSDRYRLHSTGSSDQFRSSILEACWPHGHSSVGDVSPESIAYIAGYVTKKLQAPGRLTRFDPATGEMYTVRAEFARMSLKPGIGASWVRRFARDVFPRDYVVMDGHKWPVPRYYEKLVSLSLSDWSDLEVSRHERQLARVDDSTPERLAAKEAIAFSRLKMSKRSL